MPFEAISESTADDLARARHSARSVEVIYPGIDTVAYTPEAAERAPTPVFAYLGRLKKYKGVHLVHRAFAAMDAPTRCSRSPAPATIGPSSRRSRSSLDLGDRVRFLGRISEAEKLALLRRSWALVFASPKEGWGITNLEAAACATPVVASNSPGIRESVRDGETGFLVPHGDVAAMGAAMRASRRVAPSCVGALGVRGARVRRRLHVGERAPTRRSGICMRIIARGSALMTPKLTVGRLHRADDDPLQLEHVDGTDGLEREIEQSGRVESRASCSPAT